MRVEPLIDLDLMLWFDKVYTLNRYLIGGCAINLVWHIRLRVAFTSCEWSTKLNITAQGLYIGEGAFYKEGLYDDLTNAFRLV